jgi:hypothetical protein
MAQGIAMTAHRETFYRCTFTSPRTRMIAHVRAWDAGEAMQLFQTELNTDGVEENGTIEVSNLAGAVSERARYRPEGSRRSRVRPDRA